ncbi:hypothetical protein OAB31_00075 [Polaribacter sp.]|jgi:hypothetical protein|nr:hypothetical protein [Polaribacter sp.]MBT4779242.1 hypothetical protein [Polaribacter sp.]MBT5645292.1 hypothetical protein [Polaribacter sp.]MBT7704788.1 hypothetical protein [Polaribacter sp.]MDA9092751.1 hypothetical protein [Polaribacter sp.]MDA9362814.1 hypothetical protein [Polaribacter sp.]
MITKKRVVLFLLFIFPLIAFLLLSTGINRFNKLPIVNNNVVDISIIDATETLQNKVSVICFLGDDLNKIKGGLFNLNEKVYKKFIEHKKFQIIAIVPEGKEKEAQILKEEIGAFTDMGKWKFLTGSKEQINTFYSSFKNNSKLSNLYTNDAFLIDKKGRLRGRTDDNKNPNRKFIGYDMRSVSDLKGPMKDDISVLYYEYYAAFKDRKKADRKEK